MLFKTIKKKKVSANEIAKPIAKVELLFRSPCEAWCLLMFELGGAHPKKKANHWNCEREFKEPV